MTPEELSQLVGAGESETLEFKKTTGELEAAARTLCGMLNQRGGRVIFGVDRRGRILGQQLTAGSMEDVSRALQLIDPPIAPSMAETDVRPGQQALTVTVERGRLRPYVYKGVAYLRVGATTIKLSREEANRILVERLHAGERWELESATGWRLEDVDAGEITRTLDEAIRRGRAAEPGTRNPEDILRGFGLLRDDHLLRAAVVLFGRAERLLPEYPQCLLRVARFRGDDKTEFLDNKQFRGNAFELLQRAERYLRENLPIAGRIVPNLFERQDDPLYPPEALREALANAFCHRDYTIGGGSVAVAVFDDRLDITSSGSLHFGLTAEALYHPHESLPWNPLIADVFYKRGIIESWGRGTLKMAELTQRAGLPRPDIEEIAGALLVRFRPSRYLAPQRVGLDLTERQQALLRILGSSMRRLPARDINAALPEPVAPTTLRDDLSFLRQLGLVEVSGHGAGSSWALKGKGEV